jgi:hypothetical protein
MSFSRSTSVRKPSCIVPMSPVRTKPSRVMVAWVMCGRFQYPDMIVGERTHTSPGPPASVTSAPVAGSTRRTVTSANGRPAVFGKRSCSS